MKHLLGILALLAITPAFGQITENGSYDLPWGPGTRGIFEAFGDFGGGTVTLERKIGDEWVPYESTGWASGVIYEFVTVSNQLRVTVSASTSPSLWLSIDGGVISSGDWTPAPDAYYLQPNGTDRYLQPNGTDLYLQP